MKIIVNGNILENKPTGLGVFTQNVINNLVTNCNDLLVYSNKDGLKISAEQLKLVPSYVAPSKGLLGNVLRLFWNNFIFPLEVIRNKGEVVLTTVPESIPIGRMPYVVVVHDLIPFRFPEYYKNGRLIYKYYVPIILKFATKIITVSQSTKNDLVNIYGVKEEKIKVVYCGYDNEHFKKIQDHSLIEQIKSKYNLKNYILYIGNILPHKNIKRLIKSFDLVEDYSGDLVLVGSKSDPYYEELKKLKEKSPKKNKIKFLDYISYNEVPILLSGADLFVYPSLYEGFGIPVIEAMACGVPVITSNVSSLPEVGGDASLLVNPYDEKEIAMAIAKIVNNQELKNDMINKGLKHASEFSWLKTTKNILNIVNEISLEK